uniref:Expressed protein n=2 Tax=Oryza sativa subsp. japonica TaxID=39947 RepID=Q2R538_ORYSJ|nr:expressed protein [Oryza sativa Japonica Group]AAX96165.1 hypothetical protein LOC_Os11g26350 [Oryza sativa Japonica Group]ABA93424.1 hypothetical protein LOC_Os11g26350 [Oryza sativa Japonica Group]
MPRRAAAAAAAGRSTASTAGRPMPSPPHYHVGQGTKLPSNGLWRWGDGRSGSDRIFFLVSLQRQVLASGFTTVKIQMMTMSREDSEERKEREMLREDILKMITTQSVASEQQSDLAIDCPTENREPHDTTKKARSIQNNTVVKALFNGANLQGTTSTTRQNISSQHLRNVARNFVRSRTDQEEQSTLLLLNGWSKPRQNQTSDG